jgi:hypothetical protein
MLDSMIVNQLMEKIGQDISILNEKSYIPPFEDMIKLMLPFKKRKLKTIKKPRSKRVK